MECVPYFRKCQVCWQPSHGNHFGAETCRACAAFFRRYHVPKELKRQTRDLKCRKTDNRCEPTADGKWYCKKCRMERCLALGMTPANIQFNRDRSSSTFQLKMKVLSEHIPTTMERTTGKPHVVIWLTRERDHNKDVVFFDFTHVVENVSFILQTTPDLDESMNSLEKLTFGLQEVRKTQKTNEISEMKVVGKSETASLWESEITNAARWLTYSDEFRALRHEEKFSVLKCMWHVFTRLERVAMTAQLRMRRQCGRRQFAVSHDEFIDFDSCVPDVEWFTDLAVEELEFFLGPISRWFYDGLVDDIIELQPSDTEITYLLSSLCFELTGKKFGGTIQEYTDRMQEVLADDLHRYYGKEGRQRMYSHRLIKLLGVIKNYRSHMLKGHDIVVVATVLNAFRIGFSHPELFLNST